MRILKVAHLYSSPYFPSLLRQHCMRWLAAIAFGDGLEIAYVGTQGDVWDPQKDQALAIVGSLLAILATRGQKK